MSKKVHDIGQMRCEYGQRELREEEMPSLPLDAFGSWFDEACEAELEEPNAFGLATLSEDGYPTVRTVLMKFFDARGLVFYTNYHSAKAREIKKTNKVGVHFLWLALQRQVRMEGTVEKVSLAESLTYFASRPRESQIGAWVSKQSSVIDSRSLLLNKIEEIKRKFQGREIPLPSFWGGYRFIPCKVEFWQGGKGRVHDRICYTLAGEKSWKKARLSP